MRMQALAGWLLGWLLVYNGGCSASPITGQEFESPVTCQALDDCHSAGVYSSATGTCSNPKLADKTNCTGGNACLLGRSCLEGVCQGAATPLVCAAIDACHSAGTCDPEEGCDNPIIAGGCTHPTVRLPLTGCAYSDYAATVKLGSHEYFQLIIDTGSEPIAVASAACDDCQGVSPQYIAGTGANFSGTYVGEAPSTVRPCLTGATVPRAPASSWETL